MPHTSDFPHTCYNQWVCSFNEYMVRSADARLIDTGRKVGNMHAQVIAAAEPLRQDIVALGPAEAALIGTFVLLGLLKLLGMILKYDEKVDDFAWLLAATVGVAGYLSNFGLIRMAGDLLNSLIRWIANGIAGWFDTELSETATGTIYALVFAGFVIWALFSLNKSRNEPGKSIMKAMLWLAALLSTFFASGLGETLIATYTNLVGVNLFNFVFGEVLPFLKSFGP